MIQFKVLIQIYGRIRRLPDGQMPSIHTTPIFQPCPHHLPLEYFGLAIGKPAVFPIVNILLCCKISKIISKIPFQYPGDSAGIRIAKCIPDVAHLDFSLVPAPFLLNSLVLPSGSSRFSQTHNFYLKIKCQNVV